MLKIRTQPKGDVSDTKPNDEKKIDESKDQLPPSKLISIVSNNSNDNNNISVVHEQHDQNEIHLNLEKGDQIPKSTPIPMQKEQEFMTKIDFSIFNDKQMNCQSAKTVDGDILTRCDSMHRLIEGMKCYDAMKEDPISMMDFIANHYRTQMLDDFNHFVAEHQHQSDEIMNEMISVHHFKRCDVEHCAHSKRHFGKSQRVQVNHTNHSQIVGNPTSNYELFAFYSSKYDALHFALFHLFETGYRYRVLSRPQKDAAVDDAKVAQQELAEAVSAINSGRERCRGALGRFESESNNKFNLSVGVGAESKTEDGHSVKTTTDSMMEFVASNGVGHDALVQINGFMLREDIDTDAAKDDVADSRDQSNLFAVTKHHNAFDAVKRYFALSAVSSFSIGICFFYWKWFDPKNPDKENERPRHHTQNNDYSGYSRDELFVEKPKYRDMKEEAIESGHCSLSQFAAMVFKAEELMKSLKVKRLKAHWTGHARYYGIQFGAAITVKHLQSVLLYTDFTKLCSVFSATFRPEHFGESLDSIKARNSSWFEMAKSLRETVECYGNDQDQEKGPFYCGVKRLMLVTSFGIRLCSPTSTSKASSVAIRFADTHGIVMRFNNEHAYLRFFDCSYFSTYTEEDERLFFGGDYRTRVESVMVMDGFKNYRKYFGIFYAFDLMVSGDSQLGLKEEITSEHVDIMKEFIDRTINGVESGDAAHDEYVVDTFNAYTRNKRDIVINLSLMDYYYPKGFYQLLMHSVKGEFAYDWSEPGDTLMNMLRWKRVFSLFPSLETLSIHATDNRGSNSYPFSLNEGLEALNEALGCFDSIRMVEIKGVRRKCYRGSWIHDAFGTLKEGLDLNTMSVSLSIGKYGSYAYKADFLKIQRK